MAAPVSLYIGANPPEMYETHTLSHSRHDASTMPESNRLETFADFVRHKHGLGAYCPGCKRNAQCNLAYLVMHGLGDRPINKCRPHCRKCGSRGEWQVNAPVPKLAGFEHYGLA